MSLLARVSSLLAARAIDHAVIGATALAVHGVARSTADLDLLAINAASLQESLWGDLRSSEVAVEIRHGDETDPLAGVVRISARDEAPVDIIVGKHAWQMELLRRASATQIGDVSIRVVRPADLVLLKLYAGGPQDAWDISQLLDAHASIRSEVEAELAVLPPECAALWRRICEQQQGGA